MDLPNRCAFFGCETTIPIGREYCSEHEPDEEYSWLPGYG